MHYDREDGCRAWLTYAGISCDTLNELLEQAGNAEAIFDRFQSDGGLTLRETGVTEKQVYILRARSKPEAMHEMMVAMHKAQMGILTQADYAYPDGLRNISDPPPLLFFRGNPDCLLGRCVTMIGSRKASPEGLETARTIARDLSRSGVCVISGLAAGIDTASHEGCLAGGTPTAAVMACGLDVPYPMDNEALRGKILASGGVLLGEYPPGTRSAPWIFPVRNRILSGLSKATLFVEGRVRSGSMTTVQHALAQGRDVYVYPGQPRSSWAEGAHQLIRDGARYCTCAADLLEDMGWDDAPPTLQTQAAALPPLSDEQRVLYTRLGQGDASFDQLAVDTGMDTPGLSSALTMLQIMGLVKALPGKTYHRE